MPYGQAKSWDVQAKGGKSGRGFTGKPPSPELVRQVNRESFLIRAVAHKPAASKRAEMIRANHAMRQQRYLDALEAGTE